MKNNNTDFSARTKISRILFLFSFCFLFLQSYAAKLLQKSEMRKDIVIELSYKGFG